MPCFFCSIFPVQKKLKKYISIWNFQKKSAIFFYMLTYWNWKGKQVSGSELREVTIRTAQKIFFSAFLRCFSKDIGNVCKRGQGDDRAHRGWVTLWRWTRNANFSSRGLPDQFTKWIERYAVVEELDHHVVRTCCTYTRMDFRDRRKSTQKTSL